MVIGAKVMGQSNPTKGAPFVIFYGANCVLNSVCPANLFAKPHRFAYIHAISKNIRVKYSTHPFEEDNDKTE